MSAIRLAHSPVPSRLRIALVAPPWLPVPPIGYGGTERVIALLADGLVERGHDVTLFAAAGSDTEADLVTPLAAAPAVHQHGARRRDVPRPQRVPRGRRVRRRPRPHDARSGVRRGPRRRPAGGAHPARAVDARACAARSGSSPIGSTSSPSATRSGPRTRTSGTRAWCTTVSTSTRTRSAPTRRTSSCSSAASTRRRAPRPRSTWPTPPACPLTMIVKRSEPEEWEYWDKVVLPRLDDYITVIEQPPHHVKVDAARPGAGRAVPDQLARAVRAGARRGARLRHAGDHPPARCGARDRGRRGERLPVRHDPRRWSTRLRCRGHLTAACRRDHVARALLRGIDGGRLRADLRIGRGRLPAGTGMRRLVAT